MQSLLYVDLWPIDAAVHWFEVHQKGTHPYNAANIDTFASASRSPQL